MVLLICIGFLCNIYMTLQDTDVICLNKYLLMNLFILLVFHFNFATSSEVRMGRTGGCGCHRNGLCRSFLIEPVMSNQ